MLIAVMAAVGMCADGLAEGLYAARHGFTARVAGVGYAIGAVLAWLYNAVTPITFTVESVAVATRTVRERPLVLYAVALSAVPSIVLGAVGLYSTFVELLDPAVIGGVIAGVGLILAQVGVQYVRERPAVGGTSVIVGFIAHLLTDNLVVVIVAATTVGTLTARFVPLPGFLKGEPDGAEDEEEGASDDAVASREDSIKSFRAFPLDWRTMVSGPVLLAAFSIFALRTGAVVSYDNVNAGLADAEPTLDGVTLMAGLGSLASGILGGPPVEATPAPMADTPMPVFSNVLFMALMAGLTLLGFVTRAGRFIPLQAIAGFIFVLGVPIVLPENLPIALESPIPGVTALAVTAMSNPFYGIIAGEAVALIMKLGFGPSG